MVSNYCSYTVNYNIHTSFHIASVLIKESNPAHIINHTYPLILNNYIWNKRNVNTKSIENGIVLQNLWTNSWDKKRGHKITETRLGGNHRDRDI